MLHEVFLGGGFKGPMEITLANLTVPILYTNLNSKVIGMEETKILRALKGAHLNKDIHPSYFG